MRFLRALGMCVEEAFRGLWFHRRTVAPSLVVISVSLVVLGAFLLVSENLDALLTRWRERGQLQIFLVETVTPAQRQGIAGVLDDNPAVEGYEYIAPEEAAELFRAEFDQLGDVLELLGDNPLPPSFAVTIRPEMRSERVLETLAEDWAGMPAVEGIQYDLQIIRQLERGVRGLRLGGFLLGGAVLLAAVVTTANVIRVLVVTRSREIEVMRLVGASELVVLGRFVVEGAVQGLVSGSAALIFLYTVYSAGLSYVDPQSLGFLSALPIRFLRPEVMAALLAGGTATGVVGSWLAFAPGSPLRAEI